MVSLNFSGPVLTELFKLRKMETNLIVETNIQIILQGEFPKISEYNLPGG